MDFRPADSDQTSSREGATNSLVGTFRIGQLARLAIVGVAFVVLMDLVVRYLESIGPAATVDDVRKQRGRSTPKEQTRIEIGPSDETARTDSTTEADGTDAESERDEAVDDEQTNVDLTDEERPPDEIDERAESDVQDEPATPGEMTIDEDVADELQEQDDAEEE
ncbi:hypothetical protein CV102_15905 [Natronococcus pandeyae]|uniref:Uncharacterized protein n=1 Tax=Natronococcus pandeyae TaxID=2055836 RepID=A0A8J8PZR5_9EURY|nr:hypothetical protein [Natronococcus pandeyae]TYL37460.1 hypothetical protein CV102_15905 [Natronococcus pandeyae]